MITDAKLALIIEATYIAQERINRGTAGGTKRELHNIHNERLTLFRAFLKMYRFYSTYQLRKLYPFCSSQAGLGGLKMFPCVWKQEDVEQISRIQLSAALEMLKREQRQ